MRITIISHRAREPISWIIKFLGRTEGGGEFESEPAGFAFRQPLARDLRRAVTHRTHLFVGSLRRARSYSNEEGREDDGGEETTERERKSALAFAHPGSTLGASTDSIHRGYAIG